MKLLYISILSMVAISMANAGAIEIGAGSTAGVSTQGLTAAYIASATQTGTPWAGERAYATTLFSGATITNSSLNGVLQTSGAGAGVSTGGTATLPTSQNGFQQFTDTNNGVTFALLADPATGNIANNFWASSSGSTTGNTDIVVPINLSGLSAAYILLNDYWGVNRAANDVVTFNFVTAGAVPFALTNGNQIDDAIACSSASPSFTTVNCTNYARSTTSTSTDIAWSGSYSNSSVNVTPFSGTSGTLNLLDIAFNISAYSGDTLTSIKISDTNNGTNVSRLALAAITVATPEPSTWLLLVAGLGIMGFVARRRKVQL